MAFGTGGDLEAPRGQGRRTMLGVLVLAVISSVGLAAAPSGCFLDVSGIGTGGSGTTSSGTGGAGSCNTAMDCSGGPCATMTCTNHVCASQQTAAGAPCSGKAGVCDGMGSCVACTTTPPAGCTTGQYCYGSACASCSDTMKDGDETDVDCGGAHCPPCAPGKGCAAGNDCTSHVCTSSLCAAPTCMDGMKNGTETDVDCGGGACPGCATGKACAASTDCLGAICETGACRVAHSCNELHGAQPTLPDGVYTIDFNGMAAAAPAFCDMTTDGGGWTALINPVKGSLPATVASLKETTIDLSGVSSCPDPPPAQVVQGTNGFWSLRFYGCGDVTFKLTLGWVNVLAAKDVMFTAVVQGDTTHTILLNGTPIASDANDVGLNCFSWNGSSTPPTPGAPCYTTTLNAPPHAYDGKLSGDLKLELSAGPGDMGQNGMPDPNYGTGMNIQKLSVR